MSCNTQNFRHAPRLRDTSAGLVRRVAVKDFGNLSAARFVQMVFEIFLQFRRYVFPFVARRHKPCGMRQQMRPMSHAQTVP
ncbi:MAG: hypothetical protein WKF71_17295 [Pyrinomonadaceae bacterium]